MNDTETWARDRLEQAADTVTMGAPPSIPQQRGPRRWWPVVAAAVAVVLAIAAAFTVGRGDNLGPAPTEPLATSGPPVPLLFGMNTDQARRTLEHAGTTCCDETLMHQLAQASTHFRSAMAVDAFDTTLPQLFVRPGPGGFDLLVGYPVDGRLEPAFRTTVRLTKDQQVVSVGAPPDNAAAVSGTQELVAMVRAGKPWPLYGVEMYVDGRRTPQFDDSWQVCPEHSGITCPVDVLDLIRQASEIHQQVGPPGVPCAPVKPLELDGLISVTVTPAEAVGCGNQWGVQLWWSSSGALKAVNAVLGEP